MDDTDAAGEAEDKPDALFVVISSDEMLQLTVTENMFLVVNNFLQVRTCYKQKYSGSFVDLHVPSLVYNLCVFFNILF